MMRVVFVCITLALAVQVAAQTPSPVPSNDEIRRILGERVDTHGQSVGIVVGVVEPSGRRLIAYGQRAKGDARPLDGDTIFEIGSITKVFTSLLFADAVGRGDVALTDPIAKYLPATVKVPERNGRSITLVDLSTHTSGLPRLPTNFAPKDMSNPYVDYSVQQMYDFLSTYQLTRDIGSTWEYSNLGGGLLGHVLARRAGMDYEALVRSRITAPLGMSSTSITLSADQQRRLAVGHNDKLASVPNWDLPTLAGAGALRSTANDMLTFVAANLGAVPSPLASAMSAMLTERKPTGMPGLAVALAWHIATRNGDDLIWHNGGTGGYRSFIGFSPRTKVGVVVLSNTSTSAGVDDIGLHVLDTRLPLAQAPKPHTEVAVDPNLFEGYVGAYQLAPNFVLTVTRETNRLFVQATGQPKFEIFAEAPKEYFLKV